MVSTLQNAYTNFVNSAAVKAVSDFARPAANSTVGKAIIRAGAAFAGFAVAPYQAAVRLFTARVPAVSPQMALVSAIAQAAVFGAVVYRNEIKALVEGVPAKATGLFNAAKDAISAKFAKKTEETKPEEAKPETKPEETKPEEGEGSGT